MDKKWNLQDIKPAGSSRPKRPLPLRQAEPEYDRSVERLPVHSASVPREESYEDEEEGTMRVPVVDGKKKQKVSYVTVAFILIAVFGSAVLASYFMRGAEVTVYPKFNEPNVNAVFTAFRATNADELSYEIMTLEVSGERQVTASGQQEVEELATGSVRLYKSTPGTQRLIKNTRLSDASGRVFRLTESVVIPGLDGGKPGTVSAEVFADAPGEAYNLPAKTRFTVPGLESDSALYNAIYAENDLAFSGGFSGQKFIIDEEQLATAKQSLQLELRNTLLERLPNEKPAGVVAFPDAVAFTFESLPSTASGDSLATIKEKAVLQIPLFKDEDFAKYIAAATVPDYDGAGVRIADTSVLAFKYMSATTSTNNLANLDSIEFQLTGRPLIVWTYDAGKLSTDLLGTPKTSLNTILSAYPGIPKAEVVIRPFWQRSFPQSLSDIKIIEIVGEKEVPSV